ncbi:MAG: GNAT family N-acetyltransferase [Bacteroidales bacterium]
MTIRLMTSDDYELIYQLWSETEGIALRGYDDSKEGMAKFIAKNPTSNFVAIENNEVIGAIMCGMDGRRAYIYHTTVRKDFRGQGIGKAMLREVYKAIEKEGICKNGLLVLKNNDIGNAFWKSQGWEERVDLNYYSKSME